MSVCEKCGNEMTGIQLLDSWDEHGNHRGWAEPYCGCDAPKPTPFGKALRRWRLDHKITLHEAGERSGIDVATISKVESGREIATVTEATRLARALGADTDEWADLADGTVPA